MKHSCAATVGDGDGEDGSAEDEAGEELSHLSFVSDIGSGLTGQADRSVVRRRPTIDR